MQGVECYMFDRHVQLIIHKPPFVVLIVIPTVFSPGTGHVAMRLSLLPFFSYDACCGLKLEDL